MKIKRELTTDPPSTKKWRDEGVELVELAVCPGDLIPKRELTGRYSAIIWTGVYSQTEPLRGYRDLKIFAMLKRLMPTNCWSLGFISKTGVNLLATPRRTNVPEIFIP